MLEHAQLIRGEATMPGLLRLRAKERGSQVALREKIHGIWQGRTWLEYYQTARRVAHGLTRLGLQRGDRIIIAAEDVPEWFYADLGAQMIGVQVVGIYPTNPWAEVQYIAGHCQARLAVTGDQEQTDKVLDAMREGNGLPHLQHIFCVDMKGLRRYEAGRPHAFEHLLELGDQLVAEDPLAERRLDDQIDALMPDDVNILVYTSGTTGPPKGAMLTHRNFVYGAYAYMVARQMTDKPFESVCYLPLCHVAERTYSTVQHLIAGGCVNFAESVDTVATNIREIGPTFFLGVPRIWEKLQQGFEFRMKDSGRVQRWLYRVGMKRGRVLSDRRAEKGHLASPVDRLEFGLWYLLLFRNMQRHMGLNRTHTRMCGGASVSPETLKFFDIIGLPVGQGYGLTEAGGLAFVQVPGRPFIRGSCGPAMEGVEWRLGEDNEVFVRSPGVFRGYLFDDKGTNDILSADGWIATGDIVEKHDGGEIAVVDRKKAIIITSGGKNIAPSEIENAIKDSPYVREAIVVGEGRKFLGGLVQIDFDTVGRWAAERDLQYTTYKSLTLLPEVIELVQGVINEVNSRFARVENVRRFVLLEKELDHDDGELTATQKVRRGLINKKFARELEIIYGSAP
ncbi:AMP-dependent synthetase/ligase [Hydrogenophaga laconesensis]|uniref:Long-chain acyl-CoA synthetase n=1 Tax=Hydrogenophaga laconesensis TaxID=1805971 RepID=A0ABU1V6N3_9BURK|nr:AMP-binding protein [Hydrogenophaga laconesensis]MDR7093090.1 long-chain acyl-CoA synthetase [Hydrogenophaga laconesensis]